MPRKIWSLWDKGVENAPRMQRICLESHRATNPTYEVNQLNLEEAVEATRALDVIDAEKWSEMSIQSKSDVIRAELYRISEVFNRKRIFLFLQKAEREQL